MLGWQQFPTVIYNSNIYGKEPRGNMGERTQTSLTLGQNATKSATIWKPCATNKDGNYNTVWLASWKLAKTAK